MAEENHGFLGRWARRKTDVLQGKPLEEPEAAAQSAPVAGVAAAPVAPSSAASSAEQPEKTLSLDDVNLLTRDSDFKPFMARDVGPEVRNAAMKKLFTDPHYNVMDGLDIYIDDYSRSDPIPESMLRQMVGSKLLKLFDDDDDDEEDEKNKVDAEMERDPAPLTHDNPNNPTPEIVAKSVESPDIARPKLLSSENSSQPEPSCGSGASQQDHAHSHLRLQPDHAPTAPDAGHGTS